MVRIVKMTGKKTMSQHLHRQFHLKLWLISVLCLASVLLMAFKAPVKAETYSLSGDMIGIAQAYKVQADDNLYALARQFNVGVVELLAANPGVDPWAPAENGTLQIPQLHLLPPGERSGILINLADLRLFYFKDAHTVMTFPIGIGREGWRTPTGKTHIAKKRKNPTWTPPASIFVAKPSLPFEIPAGPDNPLGEYAMNLGFSSGSYLIHGTNRPSSIGVRASHGCIRLYPEDIRVLFDEVAEGTPVTIVDIDYKLAWREQQLWLEIAPTQEQADDIAEYQPPRLLDIPHLRDAIVDMAGAVDAGAHIDINWPQIELAIKQRNGLPGVIAQRQGVQTVPSAPSRPIGIPTDMPTENPIDSESTLF